MLFGGNVDVVLVHLSHEECHFKIPIVREDVLRKKGAKEQKAPCKLCLSPFMGMHSTDRDLLTFKSYGNFCRPFYCPVNFVVPARLCTVYMAGCTPQKHAIEYIKLVQDNINDYCTGSYGC